MADPAPSNKKREDLVRQLLIILCVIVFTLMLSGTGLFQLVELGAYDYRLTLKLFRPANETSPDIVYMNIDDASLLKFGRWPWPRSHHANIISTLKKFGAKKVFLDIEFPEESPKTLKETISGKSFLHVLDVFQEGALASVGNAQSELTKRLDPNVVTTNLEGLKGYLEMQTQSLRSSVNQAILNPDQAFADAIRRCGNIYSVFFVQEPSARVLIETKLRLQAIEGYVRGHPDCAFEALPEDMRRGDNARALFDLSRLRFYIDGHIDAPASMVARDLGLDSDFVGREVETARQGVLSEAITQQVKAAPMLSLEKISTRVAENKRIANPGNYEEFLKKAFTKASSQQIVKARFSMPLFPGEPPLLDLLSSDDFQPPIPLFVEQFRGLGFSNVKPDRDGSIRRVPLLWRVGDRLVRHAAFQLVCDYMGVKEKDILVLPGPNIVLGTEKGPIAIPVDRHGNMLINWAGGFLDAFEHRSLDGVRDYLNLIQDYRFHLRQGDRSNSWAHFAEQLEQVQRLEEEEGELEFLIANPTRAADRTRLETAPQALEQTRADLKAAYARQAEMEELIFTSTERNLKQIERGLAREKAKPKPDPAKVTEMQSILSSSKTEMAEARRYREALQERSAQLESIVRNRICMVGSVASGTVDLGVMPYQEVYPKVGVHANVINTILTQRFLRKLDPYPSLVILIAIALASGLLFPRVSILGGSILLGELIFVYSAITYFVLHNSRLWVEVVPPVCAIFLNYTCISVYRYLTEQRQRRQIEGMFAKYLSQDVINDLIADPSKLKLGGEECMITPFFSDVAGFSTISEKLTATELVDLLNDYLTEMVNILLKHKGTLDKFEGDAIIAFFGAPLKFNDHAARACFCCLEMQETMIAMRERLRAEGKPQLKMRIGLNTGPAVVGNMGSKERFNYTMMGDTVNLASRLEGANKPYGTYIMINQSTHAAAKDQIEARELDRILVVGKLEPVTVYELLSKKGELDKGRANTVELYNSGIDLYRKRDWMAATEYFMKADQLPGGDPPSREYIRRCQEFAAFPPPDDWDGTYQMKSK